MDLQPFLQTSIEFGVAVLGAGSSRRMGRPKLLLPWGHTTVLGQTVCQWTELGAGQIAVVIAPVSPLSAELERLSVPETHRIRNPDPERGMFSSVLCAAHWTGWNQAITHIVLTLGDQPHLKRGTLAELIQCAFRHPSKICQPIHHGRRKHPIVFPRASLEALRTSQVADLREFLRSREGELAGFESDDAGLDMDLDTPEDYERLQGLTNGSL